jgi:hypothetical protein
MVASLRVLIGLNPKKRRLETRSKSCMSAEVRSVIDITALSVRSLDH